jgi:hypothetical protein
MTLAPARFKGRRAGAALFVVIAAGTFAPSHGLGASRAGDAGRTTSPKGPAATAAMNLPMLSAAEAERLRAIVRGTLSSDSSITLQSRRDFWRLADKALTGSALDARDLRERLTGQLVGYPIYVYEDAESAIQTRSPARSADRRAYEERMLRLGLLPRAAVIHGDEMIRQAAAGDSMRIGGRRVHPSRPLLEDALANLKRARARLDTLFTRP